MKIETIGTPALWIGFIAFVLAMIALDLAVFHRRAHTVSIRESALWTAVWIGLALLFNLGVYVWFGHQHALEFLTGYLIEKALSVDNLFVFLVLFSYFAVPEQYQHRVLLWGILGALVMRAIFIVTGTALIQKFHAVMYVFGAFLVFTGLRLLVQKEAEVEPERNSVVRFSRRLIRAVPYYRSAHFFVREGGRWHATPLVTVLVAVELSDVLFAVDSIPAIFAITTDPFIVFTSNIFAILGLRALYFLLAGLMGRFRFLKVALGLVLAFVGVKMLIVDLVDVPIGISLAVIGALLGLSVAASLLFPERTPSGDDRSGG